jgi:hypothetical protein
MAKIKKSVTKLAQCRIAEVLEEAISVSAGERVFSPAVAWVGGGNAVQIERLEVQPSGLRE